jgi:RNA polymerase sigma-70 factor (ECF subfamily)
MSGMPRESRPPVKVFRQRENSSRPADADDWTLLFAWRDGDRQAGEAIVHRYFGLLTRFFYNKVRREDAADLVSETFLACTMGRDRIEQRGSFRSFLFAIALNKLRGYYRKQAKQARELADFAEVCVADSLPEGPVAAIAQAQEARVLVRALRRLSLAEQIVVELNVIEELRGPEIAELVGIPLKTVYTHLQRGRARLAEHVRQLASDPQQAQTTLMGLETWARQIREHVRGGGSDG